MANRKEREIAAERKKALLVAASIASFLPVTMALE